MAKHSEVIRIRGFIARLVAEGLITTVDGKTYHLTEKGRELAATYCEKEAA